MWSKIVVLNVLKLDVDPKNIHRRQSNQRVQKTSRQAV